MGAESKRAPAEYARPRPARNRNTMTIIIMRSYDDGPPVVAFGLLPVFSFLKTCQSASFPRSAYRHPKMILCPAGAPHLHRSAPFAILRIEDSPRSKSIGPVSVMDTTGGEAECRLWHQDRHQDCSRRATITGRNTSTNHHHQTRNAASTSPRTACTAPPDASQATARHPDRPMSSHWSP